MFKKLTSFFTSSASALWSFLKPIAVTESGKLLEKLLPIARDIIIQVASTGKLPNEKRDLALEQLRASASAVGIDAATSVLNAAIELAYLHAKTTEPTTLGFPQ